MTPSRMPKGSSDRPGVVLVTLDCPAMDSPEEGKLGLGGGLEFGGVSTGYHPTWC